MGTEEDPGFVAQSPVCGGAEAHWLAFPTCAGVALPTWDGFWVTPARCVGLLGPGWDPGPQPWLAAELYPESGMIAKQNSSKISRLKYVALGKGCELSPEQQRWPQRLLQPQGKLQALVMVCFGKLLG